jgi:hypothetical protein
MAIAQDTGIATPCEERGDRMPLIVGVCSTVRGPYAKQ